MDGLGYVLLRIEVQVRRGGSMILDECGDRFTDLFLSYRLDSGTSDMGGGVLQRGDQ